jgi:oxaloacetate decarboxylase gamma subunit
MLMEETNLIIEGFKFMGLGMGTVFLFLIIMIFAMNAMSAIISKFFPEPQPSASTQAKTQNNNDNKNKKVIAAITAAVSHHRG